MTPAERTRIQFPICETQEQFNRQILRNRLKHVQPDPLALIDSVQPYDASIRPATPLWNILALDNTDKHRTIAATGFQSSYGVGATKVGKPDLPEYKVRLADKVLTDAGVGVEVIRISSLSRSRTWTWKSSRPSP